MRHQFYWACFALVVFMHVAGPYPRAAPGQHEALASDFVLDGRLAEYLASPGFAVDTTLSDAAKGPDAVERRRRGALFVLSQLADLVDNVRVGIEHNGASSRPAESNRRLLDTAATMSHDLLENARVDGRRLFESAVQAARTPAGAYCSASADQNTVRQASAVIREAADTFKRLSPSSNAEARTAGTILGGLANRIRMVAMGDQDSGRSGPIDQVV